MLFIFCIKNIKFVEKSLFLTLASTLSFLSVDKYENHNKLMKLTYSKKNKNNCGWQLKLDLGRGKNHAQSTS